MTTAEVAELLLASDAGENVVARTVAVVVHTVAYFARGFAVAPAAAGAVLRPYCAAGCRTDL